MGFLKKLLGGASSGDGGDKDGLYYYIRSRRSGEVIQLRLHRFNDLSQNDDGSGYFVRKVVVGTKNFERLEAEFYFDRNRNLTTAEIPGGELVDRADFDAWMAEQQGDAGDEA